MRQDDVLMLLLIMLLSPLMVYVFVLSKRVYSNRLDARGGSTTEEPRSQSEEDFDVFIGWSHEISCEVAEALKSSIEAVFKRSFHIRVFVSTEDIDPGSEWYDTIRRVVQKCKIGILVLTEDNLDAPWINFEAGALAMRGDSIPVIPFLVGTDLPESSPLSPRNKVFLNEKGFKQTISKVNSALSGPLSRNKANALASEAYQGMASCLSDDVKHALSLQINDAGNTGFATRETDSGLVYVGAPMSSIISNEEYAAFHDDMVRVVHALRDSVSPTVYFAGEHIETPDDFQGSISASSNNLRLIQRARGVVLVYPRACASSVLIELGSVAAYNKRTVVFVCEGTSLPFMADGLQAQYRNVKKIEYRDIEDLVRKIGNEGRSLFQ